MKKPTETGEGPITNWRRRFGWEAPLTVGVMLVRFVVFDKDLAISGCNRETPEQRHADLRRMVELEQAQGRGRGLSPGEAKELEDFRALERQRTRRDNRR